MLNIAIGIVVVHITAVSRCRLPLPIRESVIQVALSNPSTIPVQWEYLRTYRGSAVEDVSGILLSKVESLERHERQDLAYMIALILSFGATRRDSFRAVSPLAHHALQPSHLLDTT